VLRDLSYMQAQLKEYDGFAETRRQIMVSKPGIIQNWVIYLVSLYLSKDFETALKVFDQIES